MDSKGDYQGFGEGFYGFTKSLPDDCVEYSLFVIDAQLNSPREILSRLEIVRKESHKLAESLLKEYIWQRDGFKLDIKEDKGMTFLHGLTNYGDSVEDEWLIVYILRELSNRFEDLWIKVTDTDGEFLLIEAANTLPRWLNPEIADNRVWINNNVLRIIPLGASSGPATENVPNPQPLSLEEAHKTITTNSSLLMHSSLIEAEAFYRLQNYPSQITASLHHAVVTIPRKLAYILHERPAAIAPAIEAFYLRDPVSIKSLQSPSSSLIFSPDDLVTISVRFTKVLFAQVKSQQFSPPPSWKERLTAAEGLPVSAGAKPFHRLEIGMKLTCGFEMLLTDPKDEDNRVVREIQILLNDLADGEEILPSDEEVSNWEKVLVEDDEKWMDINFEDFERELEGKGKAKVQSESGPFGPAPPSGFGDEKTETNLKKMVERFEAFLNNDEADIEGVDMNDIDDMDVDNDEEEDDSDEDSEDEDKELSFDEDEFARMMREMMGLPAEEDSHAANPKKAALPKVVDENRVQELDSEDENETEEIQKLMKGMEAELKEAGALKLDSSSSKTPTMKPASELSRHVEGDDSESSDDEDVDIDFNLAKNLLESFKSQAGMAGPGGNLLGMMGLQFPRDEDGQQQAAAHRP